MGLNYQKIVLNASEYEYVPAEVVYVYHTDDDKTRLYKIRCKILGGLGSVSAFSQFDAIPLHTNILHIPIKGEVVLITKAPSSYANAVNTSQEYYYTMPLGLQSSPHHNAVPGITKFSKNTSSSDKKTLEYARLGINTIVSQRTTLGEKIDTLFPERLDVYPIQPYSGDIIMQGRWGQSIRMGSTVRENTRYSSLPSWKAGFGATGNPITIISNGTNSKLQRYNKFIVENPDKDDASIWLTSGQTVRFSAGSKYSPSTRSKKVDLYRQNSFGGNQIILSSDRILLNSRKHEAMIMTKSGIGLSTEGSVTIDGKKIIEMESTGKINLGINATSPAVLGDKAEIWLNEMCEIVLAFMDAVINAQYPTSFGPTGPALNVSQMSAKRSQLKQQIDKLKDILSKFVFLNEKAGGPDDESKSLGVQRESTDGSSVSEESPQETAVGGPQLDDWGYDTTRIEEDSQPDDPNQFDFDAFEGYE